MIELRLEGLPADVNAAHERLVQSFEVLSISKDYPNRDSKLVRRFVKAKLRTAAELGPAGLGDLIQAMLADSHNGIQEAINPTPELGAYHDGYQNALMELAKLAKLVPDAEPDNNPPMPPKSKRKSGRKKQKSQGFWLDTESGPVHVLGDPALADDPQWREAVEAMAKAAKVEADRFNGERN